MKKVICQFIFFLLTLTVFCQENEKTIKPVCKIDITTMGENKLKGLLLFMNDTSLVVYPGSDKQWNKGKKFNAIAYSSSRIKKITIKKNNRALKGLTIGSVIGTLPMLIGSRDGDKSGLKELTQLTVPVGGITGAILGLSEQKTFQINGSVILFREFKKSIR